MSEEPEVELVSFPYPFVDDDDAKLRCFIAKYYASSDIAGPIQVSNMNDVYNWIKTGALPPPIERGHTKPKLVKP